jgi:formylmethanofuran dehydrogenase subunit B
VSTIADIACAVCGCVCDDLRVSITDGRITRAEGACSLAEPWLLGQGTSTPPDATLDGQAAPLEMAIERAAGLLRRAQSPLVCGLTRTDTDAVREAIALAERLGANIDILGPGGACPPLTAVQEVGEVTCSLGEVRHRADLVIVWGADPVVSHPRLLERTVDTVGDFVPLGRAGRTLIVVDTQRTQTVERADLFVPVEEGKAFETLWTLRGLVHSQGEPASAPGFSPPGIEDLTHRMKTCRFGVVFFGDGLSRQGGRSVEALLRLVSDLNDHTRFYARRLRDGGETAEQVLTWTTGYPAAVNLGRGHPRHNSGEFSAQDLLLRDEVDLCVVVGSRGLERFAPAALERLRTIPVIVLDNPDVECPVPTSVRITTAVAGIHTGGTVYRMDGVPIPLRVLLPTAYPSEAEVLRAMRERLG